MTKPNRATAMAPVPADHPLMKAWTAYEATDDFRNALIWATATDFRQAGRERPDGSNEISNIQREQHVKGSFWAAFTAGFKAATERSASLHESVNPASDDERLNRVPGAGAMGAVVEYRDLIRGDR